MTFHTVSGRAAGFLFGILLAGLPPAAFAADYYIRPGGNGDGRSWSAAMAKLPASLERGSTYYLASGTYPGYDFADTESGQNFISVKKATLADHGKDLGWIPAYAAGPALFTGPIAFSRSYYIFDGQTGGGPGSWTENFGFEINQPAGENSISIIDQASHLQLAHINMHPRSTEVPGTAGLYGIEAGARHSDDISLSYSYIHDLFGPPIQIRYWTNFTLEYSLIARNISTAAEHSEAVSTHGGANHTYRYNFFDDIQGTGAIVNLYALTENWRVYGNVFRKIYTGHGVVASNMSESVMNKILVFNNTIVDSDGISNGVKFYSGGTGNEVRNNLYVNSTNVRTEGGTFSESGNVIAVSAAFANPSARDYRLTAPVGAGTTLPAPYDRDGFGRFRGEDDYWDVGAYEFGDSLKLQCVDLSRDLELGAGESGSEGVAVRTLQKFLSAQGYYVTLTGNFSQQTKKAVIAFQRTFLSQSSALGSVGPLTRAQIKKLSCQN